MYQKEKKIVLNLRQIIKEHQLIDSSEINSESGNRESTYIKPGNMSMQSQIDYIFVSKYLKPHVKYQL